MTVWSAITILWSSTCCKKYKRCFIITWYLHRNEQLDTSSCKGDLKQTKCSKTCEIKHDHEHSPGHRLNRVPSRAVPYSLQWQASRCLGHAELRAPVVEILLFSPLTSHPPVPISGWQGRCVVQFPDSGDQAMTAAGWMLETGEWSWYWKDRWYGNKGHWTEDTTGAGRGEGSMGAESRSCLNATEMVPDYRDAGSRRANVVTVSFH